MADFTTRRSEKRSYDSMASNPSAPLHTSCDSNRTASGDDDLREKLESIRVSGKVHKRQPLCKSNAATAGLVGTPSGAPPLPATTMPAVSTASAFGNATMASGIAPAPQYPPSVTIFGPFPFFADCTGPSNQAAVDERCGMQRETQQRGRTRDRSQHLKRQPLVKGQRGKQAEQDQQPKVKELPPPATEEQWQERIRKRQEAVDNFKSTDEYKNNQGLHPDDPRRPRTPKPGDRSFAKRSWEATVAQWRIEWREIVGVKKLTQMGFDESSSKVAWRNAKTEQQQTKGGLMEEHLQRAVALLA